MRLLKLGDSVWVVFRGDRAYAPYEQEVKFYTSPSIAKRYWEFDDRDRLVEFAPVLDNSPLALKDLKVMVGEPVYDSIDSMWHVIKNFSEDAIVMTDGSEFSINDEGAQIENRFFRRRN